MLNSSLVDGLRPAAPRVIEELFIHRDAIVRHLTAPMLDERGAYLEQLLALGHKRAFVAERAELWPTTLSASMAQASLREANRVRLRRSKLGFIRSAIGAPLQVAPRPAIAMKNCSLAGA